MRAKLSNVAVPVGGAGIGYIAMLDLAFPGTWEFGLASITVGLLIAIAKQNDGDYDGLGIA